MFSNFNQQANKKTNYRPDIDGLRAVAVLSVVFYHAHLIPFLSRGGFIGVDIFFVISGFLITGILLRNLYNDNLPGRIKLLDFYMRRIRRIFPVLITVLLTVLASSLLLLSPSEIEIIGIHIAAGAAYISNFILWSESGYFDKQVILKPLLHLWSLGVEEQFYIVWPFFIYIVFKLCKGASKFGLTICTALFTLVSFSFCLYLLHFDATQTFYAPWTRVWELSAGGLLACLHLRSPSIASALYFKKIGIFSINDIFSVVGFLLILFGLIAFRETHPFPGLNALVPVLGAMMVIHAGSNALINRTLLSSGFMVFIGLISYPMYLWHWPLLSFANNLWIGEQPTVLRVGLVFTACILSYITYRYIEPPLRYGGRQGLKALLLFLVMGAIGLGGYTIHAKSASVLSLLPWHDVEYVQKKVEGTDTGNVDFGAMFLEEYSMSPLQLAANLQKPYGKNDIAIFGDSHSGVLFGGLTNISSSYSFERFAVPCEVAFLDVSSVIYNQDDKTKQELKEAVLNLQKIHRLVAIDPAVKLVILTNYVKPSFEYELVDLQNPMEKDRKKILREGLERTVDLYTKAGKEILLFLDVPDTGKGFNNPAGCTDRPFGKALRAEKCKVKRTTWDDNDYRRYFAEIAYEAASKNPLVHVYDPSVNLCDQNWCYLNLNGKNLYSDSNRLNAEGARIIAEPFVKELNSLFKELKDGR